MIILSGSLIINDKNEVLLLFRKKHQHYETPGGKLDVEECLDFENPTIEELQKTAKRELIEEVKNIEFEFLKYFGKKEFVIPDGRKAVAHKFLVKFISGNPEPNEEIFSKIEWLSISKLENYPISPDLNLFLAELKEL